MPHLLRLSSVCSAVLRRGLRAAVPVLHQRAVLVLHHPAGMPLRAVLEAASWRSVKRTMQQVSRRTRCCTAGGARGLEVLWTSARVHRETPASGS